MSKPKDGITYRSFRFISKTGKAKAKTNKIIAEFMGADFSYFTDKEEKSCDNVTYVSGSEADWFRNAGKWWKCSFTPDDDFFMVLLGQPEIS